MTPGEIVSWVALALASILGIVLFLLARRLARVESRLRTLMTGAGPNSQSMPIGDLIAAQGQRLEDSRSEVSALRHAVAVLDASVMASVQCVGLVRYNPFGDTGGDQSFALALLDKRGNGVVISSLHSRTATRLYAKPIKGGASQLSLSDEEADALKQAMGK